MRTRRMEGFSRYVVGEDGTVTNRRSGYTLSPSSDKDGYLYVTLVSDCGETGRWRVHRLVLVLFRGPPPDGHESRHINGDQTDNRLENLDWSTHKRNTLLEGERHPRAKLTNEQAAAARLLRANGWTARRVADLFGVSIHPIYDLRRRTYACLGG